MKTILYFCFLNVVSVSALFFTSAQPPSTWLPKGVGGGGALFAPSISPSNSNDFSISCDMSELFRTRDFGRNFELYSFKEINGGHNAALQYTKTPELLYCINYKMNGNQSRVWPAKSVDDGRTWNYLTGNPDPTETVYFLAADYDNPDRLVMSYYGSAYFSSNGGESFRLIHSASDNGTGLIIGGIFFDDDVIAIGTNDGLIISGDAGNSFALKDSIPGIEGSEAIWSFAGAKQGNTTRFFCLTTLKHDSYVGMPNSEYWDKMANIYSLDWNSNNPRWAIKTNSPGISKGVNFPMIAGMAKNDANTIYLAGSCDRSVPVVLKSEDGGDSWESIFVTEDNQNIATGWSGDGGDRNWTYGECAMGFAICANDARRMIITDYGFVHASSNGGSTWRQCYASLADDNPAGEKTPSKKKYHSAGLENTSCWQVVWSDEQTMFACFSDIRGVRSSDKGETWSFDYSGHTANTMYRIARAPDGTLYAATSGVHDLYQSARLGDTPLDAPDPEGKVIYSTDQGASWQIIKNFGHPVYWIAIDPSNPKRIYASVISSSEGGVYTSGDIDKGKSATWQRLPPPQRTEGRPASIEILKDGSVVCTYSGHRAPNFTASSGCFIYNSGEWKDVSHPDMRYWCKDAVIDPYDAAQNTWYVSVFSGWGGPANNRGGLFRTTDRGATWTKIWNSDRVSSCAFHPKNANELYVTTEVEGLWHSSDIRAENPTFSRVESYPFRQPDRVFFNPYNDAEIWITSFGAGMKKNEGINDKKPMISASLNEIDFGEIQSGDAKDTAFVISNIGAAPLTIAKLDVAGGDYGYFQIIGGNSEIPLTLMPGEKLTLSLRFAPIAAKNYYATLTISSNSDNNLNNITHIALGGAAKNTGKGKLALISGRTTLNFGAIPGSGEITDTIVNIGDRDLTIVSVNISGANQRSFSVNYHEVNKRLKPNETQPFSIVFTPDSVGVLSAKITISAIDDRDAAFDLIIEVAGEGILSDANGEKLRSEEKLLLNALPNPASSDLIIEYLIGGNTDQKIYISLIDILGREISSIVNSVCRPGRHFALFDAAQLPAGTYCIVARREGANVFFPISISR